MEKMISAFLAQYMEKIIVVSLLVMMVLTIVLLLKINKMNRKITHIVAAVEHYLTVIMEEDAPDEKTETVGKEASSHLENMEKEHTEEAQSRIISAVLQEIFP